MRRFCIQPGSGPVRRAKNNIPPTRKHLLLTSFYEDYRRFKWVRNCRQVFDLNLKNNFFFLLFCEFANLYLTATSSIRAILRFFDRSNILLQKRPTHVVYSNNNIYRFLSLSLFLFYEIIPLLHEIIYIYMYVFSIKTVYFICGKYYVSKMNKAV